MYNLSALYIQGNGNPWPDNYGLNGFWIQHGHSYKQFTSGSGVTVQSIAVPMAKAE